MEMKAFISFDFQLASALKFKFEAEGKDDLI
jgi:hypothetical protein